MWILQTEINGNKYYLQVTKEKDVVANGLKENATAYPNYNQALEARRVYSGHFFTELKPVPRAE